MKIVLGLGNPGNEYLETRHNLGKMVVEAFAIACQANLKLDKVTKSRKAKVCLQSGCEILLVLPEVFMNLSGQTVQLITKHHMVEPKKICVVVDDIESPFGFVRLKEGGGTAGHKGLKSIHAVLGNEYIQLRMGIGRPAGHQTVADFVLQPFTKEEKVRLPEIIQKGVEVLQTWCEAFSKTTSQ